MSQSRIQNFKLTQFKNNTIINFEIIPGANCTGYTIQHSTDSISYSNKFEYLGICGNTSKNQTISFTDLNPKLNEKNFYRILIPPGDYSIPASIFIKEIKPFIVYNNPVSDNLILYTGKNSTVFIYNSAGKLIETIISDDQGFVNQNIKNYNNGNYNFLILLENGTKQKGTFIKINN